jgi:predicted HicB family RNase H-like nuclease
MKNIIEIDGHKALVTFDPELELLRGEFLGLSGGADFYAASVAELMDEAKKSLAVYLEMCREKNIEPFKAFSGKFNVRLDPSLHEAAVTAAAAESKSLNDWVSDAIRQATEQA